MNFIDSIIEADPVISKQINRISVRGQEFNVALSPEIEEELFKKFLKKINVIPTFEHKCNNCGGVLELKETEHIFRCPFCNSVYAIGTNLMYDRG